MHKFIVVIPARLDSTRLPRKLLIKINGKSVINRTYECAMNALNDKSKIIIATDSSEIQSHCESFGAITMLTSKNCLTGTDRVAEVSERIDAEQYINLQGDEPIFPVEELNNFIIKANKNINEISTGIIKIEKEKDYRNASIPKMVFSNSRKLLYSSRANIPSSKRNIFKEAYKHVCVYAFNKSHLEAFKSQKKTKFELHEDLEINRFLELDITVRCIELKNSGKALDTTEDLEIIKKHIQSNS
jgi:3-deoxy-manno-octulosonate cytidylyltransferase (CMP-KDO synthetase)